jgi:hypothetical protein
MNTPRRTLDEAGGQPGDDVAADCHLGRHLVEEVGVEHRPGAGDPLLRRLEHEDERAGQV